MIKFLLAGLLAFGSANVAQAQRDSLYIVTVDRAMLSVGKLAEFENYLKTAKLPPSMSRSYCRYGGRPKAWCSFLRKPVADNLYQDLSRRFGSAALIEVVNQF